MRESRTSVEQQNLVARLRTLVTTCATINSQVDLAELLRTVIAQAVDLVHGTCGTLGLVDGASLTFAEWYDGNEWHLLGRRLPLNDTLAGQILRRQEPQLIHPLTEDLAERQLVSSLDSLDASRLACAVIVPLMRAGGPLGVLLVYGSDPTCFRKTDMDLLEAFGHQVAVSIDKAQLFAERERRAQELEALYSTAQAMSSHIELPRLMETITEQAVVLVEADYAAVYIWNPQDERLQLTGAFRMPHVPPVSQQKLRLGEGPMGLAALHRRTLIENDYRNAAYRVAGFEHFESVMAVPLIARNELLGALFVARQSAGHPFHNRDEHLLSLMANQATTALEQAALLADARQRESDLVRSKARIEAIVNSMSDGLIAYDADGRAVMVNRRFYQLYGFDPELDDLQGHTVAEINQKLQVRVVALDEPDDDPWIGGGQEVELRDPVRFIRRMASPITDETGKTLGVVVIHRDVTEARQTQRLKDELISVISHELRTPLTSILGYAKLLVSKTNAPPEKREKWASLVLDKSRLLSRLISELLDLSRLSGGRLELHRQPADICTLVHRAVEELAVTSEQHHFIVDVPPPGSLPPVNLDMDRVDQVLTNILTNALKYSPDGGNVHVSLEQQDGTVVVAVRDHGVGIAPEHAERVFEPFYRADNSLTRQVYGTGLGLSVSKGIVEAHGGKIWFESQLGAGATFYFSLPLDSGEYDD